MPSLLVGLCAVLGTVFGVSAWSKLVAQGSFAESLRPLRLLPERLVRSAAVVVTISEVAAALGFGWTVVAAVAGVPGRVAGLVSLVLAGLLLTVLTTGIVLALRRGADASCACFGVTERPLSRRHVVRNSVLLAVVLAGLLVAALVGDATAEPAGAVLGLGTGAVVALVLIRLDDLVELFTPVPVSGSARSSRSSSSGS